MDSLLNPASLSATREVLSPISLRIRAPISSDENEQLLVLEEEEELEEGFDTASDADEESVGSSEVIVFPKVAGLPSNSWMPKAKPSGDGESDAELVEEDEEIEGNELYEDFVEIYDAMSVEDGSPSENFNLDGASGGNTNIEDGSRDVIAGVEENEPAQDDTLLNTEEERHIEDEAVHGAEGEKGENFPIEAAIKAVPTADTLEKEPVEIHSMDDQITETSIEDGSRDVIAGVEENEPAQDDTLLKTEEERQIEDEAVHGAEGEKGENFPIEAANKAVPTADTLEKEPVEIHSMDDQITETSIEDGSRDVIASVEENEPGQDDTLLITEEERQIEDEAVHGAEGEKGENFPIEAAIKAVPTADTLGKEPVEIHSMDDQITETSIEDGSRDVIAGVEENEPAQDDTLLKTEEERQIEDEAVHGAEGEKGENFPIEAAIKAVPTADTLEKEPVEIRCMDDQITETSPGKSDVMSSSEGPFDVVDKVAVIAFKAVSEIVDVHEIGNNIQKTELDVNAPEVRHDNNSVPASDLDESVPFEQSLSATANKSEREEVEGDESKDSEAQAPSLVPDDLAKSRTFLASEAIKEMLQEVEGLSKRSAGSKFDSSKDIEGKIVSDSDEDTVSNVEDPNQIVDVEALVALLKSASSSTADGRIVATALDSDRSVPHDRPTGLGSSFQPLKPPMHLLRANPVPSSEVAVTPEPDNNMIEEKKKLHGKIEQLKVMFLRLVHRLGLSLEDPLVIQVLYHLSFAEGIHSGMQRRQPFNNGESAKRQALQLEENGKENLDFSCNILILGKSGVGKSATINSIFGEERSQTSAFEPATSSVEGICGMVNGIKIQVMDTPGLRASTMDQGSSRKMLTSIKKYTKRNLPEIVLYVDRLDTAGRDQNDLPLLKSITSTMGVSVWSNAIIVLTHAGSAPPEGPMGSPLSYEAFVAQRTHAVQQSIRIAAGDMRIMNPVALVENHQSCRRNREGQGMLPNGVIWRPQLLLLCVSSKIISEVNSLLKLQDSSPAKLFGLPTRFLPLPFLLSSLLQSREHPKLPTDQRVDNDNFDIDSDDISDEDEEDEHDQLPPFKPLTKLQIAELTKEQKRAYYDEYDYRVKLLQKKQWKDELKRLKEIRQDFGDDKMVEDFYNDAAPATVPIPLPDMVLPPSFDCDAPTYRYRFLEPTSHLQVRPVLDAHGWDHDCGFDGLNLEENLAFSDRFPAVLSAQVTKDKREFSIHVDSCIAAKHGEIGSTLAGLNIQAIGKQLAYTMRGETKRKTSKKNKTTGGISVTFLGETIATGLKFEDQLSIGKQLNLTATTGIVRTQRDIAYGVNLEARFRDKEYPIGQGLSTLVISLMRMKACYSILGANFQTQISPVGRNLKVAVRVGLNNKMNGQIIIRTSTSENLQIALVGIIPIALCMLKSMIYGDETTY